MTLFRPISLCIVLCLVYLGLQGQNERDALRHSQSSYIGSARAMGMAGAYSAVGADLTSASTNPAGLGLFRSSQFALSPTFLLVGNQGEYLDTTGTGRDSYFGIPSWGVAFTTLKQYDNGKTREEIRNGLKAFTFAIGHNQMENYTRNTAVQGGFNDLSSLSDMFAERAQGIFYLDLPDNEFNAWQTLVIDTIANSGAVRYFPAITDGRTVQDVQVLESGRRNEWFISLAGNFSDQLYIGGTIGIQRLRYEQSFTYIESDVNNLYEFYETDENSGFPLEIPSVSFTFQDTFSTNGVGVNGKFGVIYRPVDALRLSLAFHTPTILSLRDNFSSSFLHTITNADNAGNLFEDQFFAASQFAQYQYTLRTPYRLNLGAMVLLGKSGFLTAEAEMIDYSSARLSSQTSNISDPNYYSFDLENQNIQDQYQRAFNLRLGGEYRVDIFRIRGGAALLGTPLTPEAREYIDFFDLETIRSVNGGRTIFSGGVGIRQPNFYLDVSFINQTQQDFFNPYFSEKYTPTVISTRTSNTIVSTVGFTF